jgi:hypothetical protein
MGFEIAVDRVVYHLWETLRPERPMARRYTDAGVLEEGLVVTLDLRLSHYVPDEGNEYHKSALAHIILTGNTSVFAAATHDYTPWHQMDAGQWDNTSNHDSCWRSDGFGFLNTLYFNMTEQMNHQIKADGGSPIAPIYFSQFCTLGSLDGKPWETVVVQHELIPGDHYRRRLVKVVREGKDDYIPHIENETQDTLKIGV